MKITVIGVDYISYQDLFHRTL